MKIFEKNTNIVFALALAGERLETLASLGKTSLAIITNSGVITMFKEVPASAYSIGSRKLIHGKAVNDSTYKTHIVVNGKKFRCPYYKTWYDMITRCLSEKFKSENTSYKDCQVCEEWLIFSNFKDWMIKQDWQGNQLDKDVVKPGNKIYSPENCAFVSPILNCIFNNKKKSTYNYKGVYPSQSGKRFKAYMKVHCKAVYIGSFEIEEEAAKAYLLAKIELAKELAAKETNQKIVDGIYQHISLMNLEINSIGARQ